MNLEKHKTAWITWETQARNAELSKAFCCEYLCLDYSSDNSLVRYCRSAYRTISAIHRARYSYVFAQCPSLLLAILVTTLKAIYGYCLVIDAHNVAIEYAESKNTFVRFLGRLVLSKADYVIVSNLGLKPIVEQCHGRPLVLPDKIPLIEEHELSQDFKKVEKPLVTLVATFAPDEPIECFLESVKAIELPFTLVVTGKRSKARRLLKYESNKIIFSDFLSREKYEGLIRHSDFLVDLTTRENCLVCGAYEALSVQTPALLSDTKALRETFPCGFIFASNNRFSFEQSFKELLGHYSKYRKEMPEAKQKFKEKWQKDLFSQVLNLIVKKDFALELLTIALWRSDKLFSLIQDEQLETIIQKVHNQLKGFIKKFNEHRLKKDEDRLKKEIRIPLELLLALLRLRAYDGYEHFLAPEQEQSKDFVILLDELTKIIVKERKITSLKSRLEFNIDKPDNLNKIPDLIYALRVYLTGDDSLASSIRLLSISDD